MTSETLPLMAICDRVVEIPVLVMIFDGVFKVTSFTAALRGLFEMRSLVGVLIRMNISGISCSNGVEEVSINNPVCVGTPVLSSLAS